MVDHAKVAELLVRGELPKNVATTAWEMFSYHCGQSPY